MRNILLRDIILDEKTQFREGLDGGLIDDLVTAYRGGPGQRRPPAVDVFTTDGEKFYLADGWNRVSARMRAGYPEINADIHQGGLREAILFAAGANAHHGARRNILYIQKAVDLLLADDEWKNRSTSWIAEQCRCSHDFVGKRKRLMYPDPSEAPQFVQGKDGKMQAATKPERFRTKADPDANGQEEGFSWRLYKSHWGVAFRMIHRLARDHHADKTPDYQAIVRKLSECQDQIEALHKKLSRKAR